MLTADTKRHIDAARQTLVGVVPNPETQIEQITNALIYKFMDDMDQAAIKAGDKPSFFVGELERYAWTRLMDSRVGNQERMNLYAEAIEKFSASKQLPELFREIFRQAYLPFRSPEVLGLFLKEIDYFDYSHSEELGNAYEYLLSILSAQGDAGQFRTPRHIIDFIVDVVNPTKEDTVLDPACGTAGFLISAYNHILEQHKESQKPLTPADRRRLYGNFEGYDVSPEMVKLSRVNMYLHHFKNPKIYEYNTLASEERWNDKFDVIMMNPPFMSPRGGVTPHNKFSVQSSRSEVLFVDYLMNHLKPHGRAGMIVPEGIIFQSGNAHKQLRKHLVEDGLYAVISLPSGVFQPYSGVKTSILLFDNELAKRSKEILFIRVLNDGYDLGAQRRKIDRDDLPAALKTLNLWKRKLLNETDWSPPENSTFVWAVSRETISETGDYNLSGDRYRVTSNVQSKFDLVELSALIAEQSKRVRDSKNIEVWSVSNREGFVQSDEYFDKQVASADISNYKIVESGCFAYNPSRINVGSLAFNGTNRIGAVSPMYVVFAIKDATVLSSKFLYSLLKSENINELVLQLAQGAVRQQLRFNDLKRIRIPLPPLSIQQQLVSELEGYTAIITGAKQIVENWKPRVEIDPEWEKVKLGEVCDYAGGTQPPKSTFIDRPKDGYIRLLQIRDYKTDNHAVYIPIKAKHKTCIESDVMIGRYGPPVFQILRGKAGAYNVALMKCLPDNSKITNDWLYYFLLSDPVQEKIISVSGRVRQSGVRPDDLNELMIPLPPLSIQKQIVEKIEAERTLVEAAKKMIEIYEQKKKDAIAKVWEQ